ncbi:hypothetical protein [Hyphomonas sp. ND6WE1B]|uniref:hypothetical protein n=1 Tax=Hyphomonas sp. ND6WE1B TaxID=1848191 RepID=UPI00080760C2|nr:hypothetical protein [Hyphomonas sp. ND6WE1B]
MEKTLSKREEALWGGIAFALLLVPLALLAWGVIVYGPALAIVAGVVLFFYRPLTGLGLILVTLLSVAL